MGTKFSIKDPNPGIWFSFDDEDPNSGRIAIRPVTAARVDEITKRCHKKKVEYKHGQRFDVVDTNEEKAREMLWDYVIADWENLEDDEGKPIDCTVENKVFLMMNHVGFQTFVHEKREEANEIAEDLKRDSEKNSLSGLSDLKKSRHAKPADK